MPLGSRCEFARALEEAILVCPNSSGRCRCSGEDPRPPELLERGSGGDTWRPELEKGMGGESRWPELLEKGLGGDSRRPELNRDARQTRRLKTVLEYIFQGSLFGRVQTYFVLTFLASVCC